MDSILIMFEGQSLINLYDDRQRADYDFYLHATESEAQVGIENAEKK